MADEILEIKFEGGGINPSAVPASEVAELITSFEKAILATLQDRFPEIDTKQYAYLSISQIESHSLGLKFLAQKATDAFVTAYLLVSTSISNNSYNDLPFPAVENLKVLSRFTQKHNCDCNYIHNGQTIAQLKSTATIELNENNILKGETVIYGKIQRVGGEVPRVTFKDHTGQNIYFQVSEEIAILLAPKLYKEVALVGKATWDKKSYKVIDFKVADITDLESKSLTETFSQIRDIIGKYWDEVDDIESVIN